MTYYYHLIRIGKLFFVGSRNLLLKGKVGVYWKSQTTNQPHAAYAALCKLK